MRLVFILVFVLQSFLPARSQNIDSITRSMDSTSRQLDIIKKRLQGIKDTMDRRQIQRMHDQQGQPLEQFLGERREAERKQRRLVYVAIGVGILFLVMLIIGLMRKRKSRAGHM